MAFIWFVVNKKNNNYLCSLERATVNGTETVSRPACSLGFRLTTKRNLFCFHGQFHNSVLFCKRAYRFRVTPVNSQDFWGYATEKEKYLQRSLVKRILPGAEKVHELGVQNLTISENMSVIFSELTQ